MSTPDSISYEFGPFHLIPAEGQLLRDGQAVTLTPKAFEALVILIENRGHLIEKEVLMKALWPDTFVEEANLAHHVWRLRKVLEDTKDDERYIETVPKRGYRFVASVSAIDDQPVGAVIEQDTITHLVAERQSERVLDSRIDPSPRPEKWFEREFKRALELNPNSAEAHHSYSNYLQMMTRFDEALAEIKRAEELDPISLGISFHHGLCLFAMGRPDEALEQYRKTLDIDSSTGAMGSLWGIAMVYEERGMYEEAIRELEEAKRLDPRPKWRMTGLVEAYALAGRRKEASDMLAQLLELRK